MNKWKHTILAVSCLWMGAALAHSPVFTCQKAEGDTIACKGGFSDGSDAKGVKIIALSYDDEELWSGNLDDKSEIVLERPEGDFYLKFDGGRGHSVDVDHSEIN